MLSVWGFDVPLRHREAIARLRTRFQGVASDLGKDFVDVSTNLRCTRWSETDWPYLAHGCALAAVGLALERRYDRVLIAATGGYRDLHPWGSHPLTDPLLSTTSTTLVHDGAGFTRVQKTELLVTSEVARGALRVCWRSESDENCGECNKCYRTALILELLGALGRCSTFPNEPVDLGRAGRVYCAQPWDFREFRDIRALALRVGRPDIAKAATRSMQRSPRLMRRLALARALRGRRGLRYLGERLERELRAGWIE
jgi:hypothetical protein